MKKNALASTGLSLSQAQSVSNLIFQRTREIDRVLSGVNNASKKVSIGGETYDVEMGKPLPENIVALLLEKGTLHATQAFLMENIKAKDVLLTHYQRLEFILPDSSELVYPDHPELEQARLLTPVTEAWGWEQLTLSELNEFLEAEALAAHVGQFIHKGGTLDKLREELPQVKTLEWMEVTKDVKTPVKVTPHHSSEQLLTVHNELAGIHRKWEQLVNYYKAKVKNLVTEENARIARHNGEEQSRVNAINSDRRLEHQRLVNVYTDEVKRLQHTFAEQRQGKIRETAALRIQVDPRFQDVVDHFLKQVEESN